jgi:hypothetical protein
MARKEEYRLIRVNTPDRSYDYSGTEEDFDKEVAKLEKLYPANRFEFDVEWHYDDEEGYFIGMKTVGNANIDVDFKNKVEGDKYYKKLAKFYGMPSSKK